MICPACAVQMHQLHKIGGGLSRDDYYETWEVKYCPECGRLVKEFYSVKEIYETDLETDPIYRMKKSKKNKLEDHGVSKK
jgi:hypothetical protein